MNDTPTPTFADKLADQSYKATIQHAMDRIDKLNAEWAAVTEQRDRLAEALDLCLERLEHHTEFGALVQSDMSAMHSAREALAAVKGGSDCPSTPCSASFPEGFETLCDEARGLAISALSGELSDIMPPNYVTREFNLKVASELSAESKDPHRFCRGGGGNNFHCGCKYDG